MNTKSRFICHILIVLAILFLSALNVVAKEEAAPADDFKETRLKGERLFKGLTRTPVKWKACISCHNVAYIDTLNWNPSALDIAGTYANKSVEELKAVLQNPIGNKMEESHQNYNFTDEEYRALKTYLVDLNYHGFQEPKPRMNQLLLFFLLGGILTFCLIDLAITHKIKYKLISIIVFTLAFGYQLKMVAHGAIDLGRKKNYAPDQPIKFSHQIHATENKIDCRYCHTSVDQSKSAGIPPVSLCLNCHSIVREGSNSGKFEINKIHAAVENNIPIEWIRIHQLPDHVFFSHAQHVNIGKRDCAECHGKVEEMHILRQVEDLSMGWCLDCHDKTAVQFNTNVYYSKSFKELHQKLKAGLIDSVRVSDIGGRECARCHY
jgi:cytochrome c553